MEDVLCRGVSARFMKSKENFSSNFFWVGNHAGRGGWCWYTPCQKVGRKGI